MIGVFLTHRGVASETVAAAKVQHMFFRLFPLLLPCTSHNKELRDIKTLLAAPVHTSFHKSMQQV